MRSSPPGWQTRFLPSEVKATTPATCLMSSCLPGQRRPSLMALDRRHAGPSGRPEQACRPRRPRPRPPPPPPPPPPPVRRKHALAGGSVELGRSRRCGSSLSASLSFQCPLKSTPAGGACASFSLAHAARHTNVMSDDAAACRNLIMKPATGGISPNQPAERWLRGAARRSVGSANPHAAFERLKAHTEALRFCAWFACRRQFCRRRDPPGSNRPGRRWARPRPSAAMRARECALESRRPARRCRAPRA